MSGQPPLTSFDVRIQELTRRVKEMQRNVALELEKFQHVSRTPQRSLSPSLHQHGTLRHNSVELPGHHGAQTVFYDPQNYITMNSDEGYYLSPSRPYTHSMSMGSTDAMSTTTSAMNPLVGPQPRVSLAHVDQLLEKKNKPSLVLRTATSGTQHVSSSHGVESPKPQSTTIPQISQNNSRMIDQEYQKPYVEGFVPFVPSKFPTPEILAIHEYNESLLRTASKSRSPLPPHNMTTSSIVPSSLPVNTNQNNNNVSTPSSVSIADSPQAQKQPTTASDPNSKAVINSSARAALLVALNMFFDNSSRTDFDTKLVVEKVMGSAQELEATLPQSLQCLLVGAYVDRASWRKWAKDMDPKLELIDNDQHYVAAALIYGFAPEQVLPEHSLGVPSRMDPVKGEEAIKYVDAGYSEELSRRVGERDHDHQQRTTTSGRQPQPPSSVYLKLPPRLVPVSESASPQQQRGVGIGYTGQSSTIPQIDESPPGSSWSAYLRPAPRTNIQFSGQTDGGGDASGLSPSRRGGGPVDAELPYGVYGSVPNYAPNVRTVF
eukprot:PhF_6_TR16931/c0_g1_i1/m.25474